MSRHFNTTVTPAFLDALRAIAAHPEARGTVPERCRELLTLRPGQRILSWQHDVLFQLRSRLEAYAYPEAYAAFEAAWGAMYDARVELAEPDPMRFY